MNENFSVRTQRLKQAKDEAEKEAAQYRSQMEEEYQKSLSEVNTYIYIFLWI
jgi:vacuolar-type H+-ATPase subunit H